jgi:hypothetical protein
MAGAAAMVSPAMKRANADTIFMYMFPLVRAGIVDFV